MSKRQNPAEDVIEEGMSDPVPTQSPAEWGEEHGSASIPTIDDDTDKMVKDVIGEEPEEGETLADIINSSEKERRIGPDEEQDLEDDLSREPGIERLEDLEQEDEDEESEYEG